MDKKCKVVMLTTNQNINMNDLEIWKDVKNYEGLYQVSNLGNIKSLDRIVETKNRGNYLRKGKLQNKSINSFGYESVGFTINSKTKIFLVHRLVAIAFIENPENKPQVNHIDGIKTNNHVYNLEWNTCSENQKHSVRIGLSNPHYPILRKELNGRSLLNENQVLEIRSKYIPYKYSVKKLALEYNVSESCITHILNNTSWKNIVN